MSTLEYILIFTLLGSIFSLAGGLLLLAKEKFILKISHLLISFAAGTLLGTAFFDLLPEAFGEKYDAGLFFWTLFGILIFFLLERFIHWFHSHTDIYEGKIPPAIPLIIVGDSVHNFIDGVAIAASFLISVPLGIVTSVAVGLHEIPQEIGDFSVMLHKKIKKTKIILVNLISALFSLAGAVLTFFLQERLENLLPIVLSITAGFFIYIASSDLIPEIHHEKRKYFAIYETFLLILGTVVVYALTRFLHI